MSIKTTLFAAVAATLTAIPAFAADITINDPYARVSSMMAKSGAAFMVIENAAGADDRLVAASSDVAEKVELHTHKEDDMGVMRMLEVEEGFVIPAGGSHALARGGDHVMFLGLTRELDHGDVVDVTLTFEQAGDVTVQIPVDLERKPMHGGQMQHGMGDGQMNHGNMAPSN